MGETLQKNFRSKNIQGIYWGAVIFMKKLPHPPLYMFLCASQSELCRVEPGSLQNLRDVQFPPKSSSMLVYQLRKVFFALKKVMFSKFVFIIFYKNYIYHRFRKYKRQNIQSYVMTSLTPNNILLIGDQEDYTSSSGFLSIKYLFYNYKNLSWQQRLMSSALITGFSELKK